MWYSVSWWIIHSDLEGGVPIYPLHLVIKNFVFQNAKIKRKMTRLEEIRSLFDKVCNTNLTIEDSIPEISSEDKVKLVRTINDAKAEAERLHIIDIMNKVCK